MSLICVLMLSNSSSEIVSSFAIPVLLYNALYIFSTVGSRLFFTIYAAVLSSISFICTPFSTAVTDSFKFSSVTGISYDCICFIISAATAGFPVISSICSWLKSSPYIETSTPAFASTAFILSVSVTMVFPVISS